MLYTHMSTPRSLLPCTQPEQTPPPHVANSSQALLQPATGAMPLLHPPAPVWNNDLVQSLRGERSSMESTME